GVDHLALVEGGPAVADVVGDGGVGVAGLGQPDEVGVWALGAVGGDRPALDGALEVVGDAAPNASGSGVAVAGGDVRRGDQAGDLGRDRGRREAALLL